MNPLTLPPRLKSLYDHSQHRPADLAQQSYMHWLDNFSKPLTFFPEYTDQGKEKGTGILSPFLPCYGFRHVVVDQPNTKTVRMVSCFPPLIWRK